MLALGMLSFLSFEKLLKSFFACPKLVSRGEDEAPSLRLTNIRTLHIKRDGFNGENPESIDRVLRQRSGVYFCHGIALPRRLRMDCVLELVVCTRVSSMEMWWISKENEERCEKLEKALQGIGDNELKAVEGVRKGGVYLHRSAKVVSRVKVIDRVEGSSFAGVLFIDTGKKDIVDSCCLFELSFKFSTIAALATHGYVLPNEMTESFQEGDWLKCRVVKGVRRGSSTSIVLIPLSKTPRQVPYEARVSSKGGGDCVEVDVAGWPLQPALPVNDPFQCAVTSVSFTHDFYIIPLHLLAKLHQIQQVAKATTLSHLQPCALPHRCLVQLSGHFKRATLTSVDFPNFYVYLIDDGIADKVQDFVFDVPEDLVFHPLAYRCRTDSRSQSLSLLLHSSSRTITVQLVARSADVNQLEIFNQNEAASAVYVCSVQSTTSICVVDEKRRQELLSLELSLKLSDLCTEATLQAGEVYTALISNGKYKGVKRALYRFSSEIGYIVDLLDYGAASVEADYLYLSREDVKRVEPFCQRVNIKHGQESALSSDYLDNLSGTSQSLLVTSVPEDENTIELSMPIPIDDPLLSKGVVPNTGSSDNTNTGRIIPGQVYVAIMLDALLPKPKDSVDLVIRTLAMQESFSRLEEEIMKAASGGLLRARLVQLGDMYLYRTIEEQIFGPVLTIKRCRCINIFRDNVQIYFIDCPEKRLVRAGKLVEVPTQSIRDYPPLASIIRTSCTHPLDDMWTAMECDHGVLFRAVGVVETAGPCAEDVFLGDVLKMGQVLNKFISDEMDSRKPKPQSMKMKQSEVSVEDKDRKVRFSDNVEVLEFDSNSSDGEDSLIDQHLYFDHQGVLRSYDAIGLS